MPDPKRCGRCGTGLPPDAHGKRKFCPQCSMTRQKEGYIYFVITPSHSMAGSLEHIDPIEEMPILINVWPRNYGLNQVDEEGV